MMMRPERDKGFSKTGFYYTYPSVYSTNLLANHGDKIECEVSVIYRDYYVNPLDPYAFHSKDEVDQFLAEESARLDSLTANEFIEFLNARVEQAFADHEALREFYKQMMSEVETERKYESDGYGE